MFAQEAIDFLVSRIQQQSNLDGVPLSDVELQMLRWSENEPEGVRGQELNDQFEAEYESGEYENKISGLLSRAYQHDQTNPANRARWANVGEALKGRDFYLLVMLDNARTAKSLIAQVLF